MALGYKSLISLGLLFIRVAERGAKDTWRNLRHHLAQLHVETFEGPAGRVTQRTELTPAQAGILRPLRIPEPPRELELTANDG